MQIPVVVNVLYRTAAQNISAAQIQSQIDVLNEDFGATNADYNNTPSIFQGLRSGNCGITFSLVNVVRKSNQVRCLFIFVKHKLFLNNLFGTAKRQLLNIYSSATLIFDKMHQMKHHLFTAILFTVFVFTTSSAQEKISLDSIANRIGQDVTVCSKVFGTFVTKDAKPITYLNLGGDFPNQKLTVVIFKNVMDRLSYNPSEYFKLKDVCVTGKLELYHDKPQIILGKANQISINKN